MDTSNQQPRNTEELKFSKYLPIWKALKETGYCRLVAPPIHHKRIVKAVQKRRDKDLYFLYSLAEQHLKHKIQYTITGTVLEFRLTKYLSYHAL